LKNKKHKVYVVASGLCGTIKYNPRWQLRVIDPLKTYQMPEHCTGVNIAMRQDFTAVESYHSHNHFYTALEGLEGKQ